MAHNYSIYGVRLMIAFVVFGAVDQMCFIFI